MLERLLLCMLFWCDFDFVLHYNNNLILSYSADSHEKDKSEEDEEGRERKTVLCNSYIILCELQRQEGGCCCTCMVICGGLMLNSSAARNVSLVLMSFSTTAKFTISSPARNDWYLKWEMMWLSVVTEDEENVMGKERNEANQREG